MSEALLNKILVKVVNIEARLDDFATKRELRDLENRIYGVFDKYTHLFEKYDIEITSLRSGYKRLDQKVDILEKKVI